MDVYQFVSKITIINSLHIGIIFKRNHYIFQNKQTNKKTGKKDGNSLSFSQAPKRLNSQKTARSSHLASVLSLGHYAALAEVCKENLVVGKRGQLCNRIFR